jgi:phosphoenolpyruvate-protein kinase (PTS system EI component)
MPSGNEKAGRLLPVFSFQNTQIEVMIEIPAAAVMVERRREK